VQAYTRAAELDPENIEIWNTLAYVQGFVGDLEAAKRSIAQYQKLQPQDVNSYDSLGEIYFYQGRFRDAEPLFLRAFEGDKTRLGGGEAYRAALAAFLAGDSAKAEANFAKYLAFRKQNKDELTELRECIWWYSTGRREQAIQKASGLAMASAKGQVALWNAMEGKEPAAFGEQPQFAGWKALATGRYSEAVDYWKAVYDGNSLINGNEARVLLAAALHGAKREAEAQALLAKWPFPPTGAEPGFSSIVFAKAVELKAGSR
jgi:tetratricopeptide (TPR) repeat protein